MTLSNEKLLNADNYLDMTVFEFGDYRTFLRRHIENLPKRGRGEISRLAQTAGVHPSLFSQILSGEKNLSLEQAQLVSEHMDLTIQETEYFITLVLHDRSGTPKLKTYFKQKLNGLKQASIELSQTVRQDRKLSDEEKAIVYSHWIYLSVWLFSSIGKGKTVEEVCQRFEISRERALEVLNFLTSTELCFLEFGRYRMGSQSIHIARGSPHLYKHHSNWRIKAINASDQISAEELMYTAPMSISIHDFKKIRERLSAVIKEVTDTAIESKAEDLVYFGLDFFWIKK